MFEYVAVEHPVSGIVSHESDFHNLVWCYEHRVLPFAISRRLAVSGKYSETVPVQMDGMPPGRLVTKGQNDTLASG